MTDQFLLDALYRLENKVDAVALDVKSIQIEQAEMRGFKKAALYLASMLGTAGGAVAGFVGHKFGAW